MIRRSLTGILVAAVLIGLSATANAAKLKATLANIKGDVQVQAAAGADFKKAAEGVTLGEGATIKTGTDGEAILKWGAGNVVSIFPLTKLSVEELVAEDNGDTSSKLNLTNGRALSQAGKLATPKSAFTVKTPTAVAGVRGTSFDAAVPPLVTGSDSIADDSPLVTDSVSIAVVDGTVVLTIDGTDYSIEGGFEFVVKEGEVPITPSAIPEARLQNLQSAVNVLKQIAKEMEKESAKEEKKEEKKEEEKEDEGAANAAETALENAVQQATINDVISDIAEEAAAGCPAGGGCIEGTIEFP